MDDMSIAHINPEMIAWVRTQRGLTYSQISTSKITADQIEAWENGRAKPTYAQIEAFAKRVKLPLLMLFLSNPPTLEVKLPDLRTKSGARFLRGHQQRPGSAGLV
jgi:transcriptional regulator with XRE-family HTH domain